MSSEHKKPFFAFVVIAVACCVFMGYTVRANALMGLFHGAGSPAATVAEALRINGDVPRENADDGDATQTETSDSTVLKKHTKSPAAKRTAEPVARTGFGKESPNAEKIPRRVGDVGNRDDSRSLGAEDTSHDRGHSREHAPGQSRTAESRDRSSHGNRAQGNRDHPRGYEKHQRSNRGNHHNQGNRDHQRGYEKHQRSNRGNHHNRGNRGRGNHR